MVDNTFTVIKTFHSLVEAKLAKSKLDSYGINSWLDNENVSSLNWFYINATGGIKLRVEQKDTKKAKELLSEKDNNTKNKSDTNSRTKTKIVWLTIIAIILGIIFFSSI
jgi:hypothetical protein